MIARAASATPWMPKNPSKPARVADRPVGEWNTFHIVMKGDKVTVVLNGQKVVDDVALGVVGATMGPVARFVNWTNTYIFDGIVNAVGGATKYLGGLVYNGLDQIGVDGVFNGLSAVADSAGSALRKMQTGRVQQYASGVVAGALILVVLFVFVV